VKPNLLKIANDYGNVQSIPKGYVHVEGQRLQPLCRKLGILYAEVLTGWGGTKRFPKPIIDGVCVTARSAPKLEKAISERESRNPESKRAAARARREKKQREEERSLRALGILPGTRTAAWLRRGDIDEDLAALIAFKAKFRHEHTDYDQLLPTQDRDDARENLSERPVPNNWIDYLDSYDFPHEEIAQALAGVLQIPEQAHPVWFCEAVLAVKRAGLPLESLTYEAVRESISDWRDQIEDERDEN
jgi:hypothetical protein